MTDLDLIIKITKERTQMKKLMLVTLLCLLTVGFVSVVNPVVSPQDFVHPKI